MKHYLSICALYKDEAAYLEEWMRFYDRIGVEHFFLYSNDSTDNHLNILGPWQGAGRITLYDTPGATAQSRAYRHFLATHADSSFWTIFVDLDEFLFSPTRGDLREFLQAYEVECGVVANWMMFGSSGHQSAPGGLITLNYTRRCRTDLCTFDRSLLKKPSLDPQNPGSYHRQCDHIKTIVNSSQVRDIRTPHCFEFHDGRKPVNANRRTVPYAYCDDLSAIGLLRINHYFSRSWQQFIQKLRRGRADTTLPYNAEVMMQRHRLFDEIEDKEIFPLARQVEADILAQKPPRPIGQTSQSPHGTVPPKSSI